MTEINPTPPEFPSDKQNNSYGGVGKTPKKFSGDSPIDAGGKNFGTDTNWFNNFTEKQRKQFLSNLSQSISAQMKQQDQEDQKARDRLKAAEEGKDPSDVD